MYCVVSYSQTGWFSVPSGDEIARDSVNKRQVGFRLFVLFILIFSTSFSDSVGTYRRENFVTERN